MSEKPNGTFLAGLLLAGIVSGCANDPPQPAESVGRMIDERVHLAVDEQTNPSPEVVARIAEMLVTPLTLRTAAQIALLNNHALAVQFEDVGVARADYIAASQIKNPAMYVDFRFPDRRPPSGTDIEATAAQDVLDILLLPLRKRLAQQELDQAAVRSADAALQLVHDTRIAVYNLQVHQQQAALQKQNTAAAAASADFASRQYEAGNINDLELTNQQSMHAQAQLEELRVQSRVDSDREQLNRLMGLSDSQIHWTITDGLNELPEKDPDLSATIAAAEKTRLDIRDAQAQVGIADQALTFTRNGVLTQVNIGASMERQSDHQTVLGPSLGLELPIFNQHQGQIARAEAEKRQALKKLEAIRTNARCEIRLASAQVANARAMVELATRELLPSRIARTAAMQQQYNGMLVGVYALLGAKQEELSARREALDAVSEYWTARTNLDRAMGY